MCHRNAAYQNLYWTVLDVNVNKSDQRNQDILTLIDFQNITTYFPKLKFPEHEGTFISFLKTEMNDVDLLKVVHSNGKVILGDCFILTFKSLITNVRNKDLEDFEHLVNSFKELLWYLSPHIEKLAARSLHLPKTLKPLTKLNNPKRHGHKVQDINQENLLSLVGAANSHLEKSYVTRTNFEPVRNVLRNLIQIYVKYSDYLTKNKSVQKDYQASEDEPQYKKECLSYQCLKIQTFKVTKLRGKKRYYQWLIFF